MDSLARNFLSPANVERKLYRAKREYSYSQKVEKDSITPVRQIQSMPALRLKCENKKQSSDTLISVGKKMKTLNGEVPFYHIQMVNSYTGVSHYYHFSSNLQLPSISNKLLEPESVLTDEDLIEFNMNSIRSWFYKLVKVN